MKIIRWFTPLVLLLFWAGCEDGKKNEYVIIDGFAQGTTYHFVLNTTDTTGLQHSVDSLLRAVDLSMSVYEEKSLVNRLNAGETDSVDRFIAYCIELARRFSEMSDGAYDITIKPVTEAIGYAGGEARPGADIDSLLQYVGYDKIKVENGRLIRENPAIQIDLNSVAQGYTADLLGELMESRGIENYLVEIGGELFCRGTSPREGDLLHLGGRTIRRGATPHEGEWKVSIDKPVEGNLIPGNEVQVQLAISGMGLATSGNYRKFYVDGQGRKFAHIVNAKTGESELSDLLSVTVVAENAAIADVAGTMLMVVGRERAIKLLEQNPQWMAYMVYDDGKGGLAVYQTENIRERTMDPLR